jgi:hypothetical protein
MGWHNGWVACEGGGEGSTHLCCVFWGEGQGLAQQMGGLSGGPSFCVFGGGGSGHMLTELEGAASGRGSGKGVLQHDHKWCANPFKACDVRLCGVVCFGVQVSC